MYQQIMTWCAGLSRQRIVLSGLIFAIAIEALMSWARFGLGLQSTRDTSAIGEFTFGVRIHHGYIGVVLLLIAWRVMKGRAGLRAVSGIVGVAFVVSDLLHHFVVLWMMTGSPQFDFVYPLTGR